MMRRRWWYAWHATALHFEGVARVEGQHVRARDDGGAAIRLINILKIPTPARDKTKTPKEISGKIPGCRVNHSHFGPKFRDTFWKQISVTVHAEVVTLRCGQGHNFDPREAGR